MVLMCTGGKNGGGGSSHSGGVMFPAHHLNFPIKTLKHQRRVRRKTHHKYQTLSPCLVLKIHVDLTFTLQYVCSISTESYFQ